MRPGGVAHDFGPERLAELRRRLAAAERDMRNAVRVDVEIVVAAGALRDTAILTREAAARPRRWSARRRAPAASTCDARRDFPEPLFARRRPQVAIGNDGDVFARAMQRWREIENSLAFLNEALDEPGDGPARQSVAALMPDAVVLSLVEGWRGEIVHIAVTDAEGRFAQLPDRGSIVPQLVRAWRSPCATRQILDFPLCNKSFNLSYCGHDL